jgi:hypothetical protein
MIVAALAGEFVSKTPIQLPYKQKTAFECSVRIGLESGLVSFDPDDSHRITPAGDQPGYNYHRRLGIFDPYRFDHAYRYPPNSFWKDLSFICYTVNIVRPT